MIKSRGLNFKPESPIQEPLRYELTWRTPLRQLKPAAEPKRTPPAEGCSTAGATRQRVVLASPVTACNKHLLLLLLLLPPRIHSRGRSGFCNKLPTTAPDTRPLPDKLSDKFDTDATEPAPGRRHLVESCTEDGWVPTPSFFLAG